MSSSSSSRRKAEEKATKAVRELGAEPQNKTCFDCHQRGPTYVNCTIGAFVCTGCSGILRGLNPPHRVKSISMATFSPDEIDALRQRGNTFCKRVWLGLYDGSRQDGTRDEQQMKDFLAIKYEKRRWYVEPTEAARQESLRDAAPQPQPSPALPTDHDHAPPPPQAARPHPHPVHSASLDLFSTDPFGSPVHAPPVSPPTQAAPPARNNGDGFADFESNFAAFAVNAHPQPPPPPTQPVQAPRPPPGFVPTPMLQANSLLDTAAPPCMPKSATMPGVSASGVPQASNGGGGGDKYSALKELDGLFGPASSEADSGGSFAAWSSAPSAALPTPGVPAFGGPDPFAVASPPRATAMPKSVSAFGAFGSPPANPFGGWDPSPAPPNPFLPAQAPTQSLTQPSWMPHTPAPPPLAAPPQAFPQLPQAGGGQQNQTGGGSNWNPFL